MQVQKVDFIEQYISEIFETLVQNQDSIENDAKIELDPEYEETLIECMAIGTQIVLGNSCEESEAEEGEKAYVKNKSRSCLDF